MTVAASGFFVNGDGKALAILHTILGDIILATQNQDSLKVFGRKNAVAVGKKWITLQPGDFSAEIFYPDNSKTKKEFYYGAGFLSQSSRKIRVDAGAVKMVITDFKGNKREGLK